MGWGNGQLPLGFFGLSLCGCNGGMACHSARIQRHLVPGADASAGTGPSAQDFTLHHKPIHPELVLPAEHGIDLEIGLTILRRHNSGYKRNP
jgi:hypothetical protein